VIIRRRGSRPPRRRRRRLGQTAAVPHLDASADAVLAGAALLAGAANAIAGGGSLISFPALLWAGYPPVTANVTNTVALLPGYAGGTLAYRRELAGQGRRMRMLSAVSVAGALLGSLLLLVGPAALFSRLVPWLILLSCALLAAQPVIARWLRRRRSAGRGERSWALLAAQLVGAAYGAYFGAGVGVLMLALLGIFVEDGLQRLNALKGLLSLVINLVAAVCFVAVGRVAGEAVAIMAAASMAGAQLGVVAARRLGDRLLRVLVVAFGVAVALRLLL
jgi:uncharacterized protein